MQEIENIKKYTRLLFIARYKQKDTFFSNEFLPFDIFKIIFKDARDEWICNEWERSPSEKLLVLLFAFGNDNDMENFINPDYTPSIQLTEVQRIKLAHVRIESMEWSKRVGRFRSKTQEEIMVMCRRDSEQDRIDIHHIWEDYIANEYEFYPIPGPFANILEDKQNFIKYFAVGGGSLLVFDHVFDDWKNDKEFLTQVAVKCSCSFMNLSLIDKDWKTNKQLCLDMVTRHGGCLEMFDQCLINDKDCQLAAIGSKDPHDMHWFAKTNISKEACIAACKRGLMQHNCNLGLFSLHPVSVPNEYIDDLDVALAQAKAKPTCDHWKKRIKVDMELAQGENLIEKFAVADGNILFDILGPEASKWKGKEHLAVIAIQSGRCSASNIKQLIFNGIVTEKMVITYIGSTGVGWSLLSCPRSQCDDVGFALSVIKKNPAMFAMFGNPSIKESVECVKCAIQGEGYTTVSDKMWEYPEIWKAWIEKRYFDIICIPKHLITCEMVKYAAVTRYLKIKQESN